MTMRHSGLLDKEVAGYRLISKIGSGGMGTVYRAYHPSLKREAAIKILFQEEFSDRFKNEASIQSSVKHVKIARMYDYVTLPDLQCIIMEYIDGDSLDAYIRKKGKLSSKETVSVLRQVLSAIIYLHSRGIIHRDIKSQNFKIQKDGAVKMLDFGIAKDKDTPRFTRHGFMVGTTEYMAPEQFNNEVEKSSDIWSLGVMTYEMVTGYLPFEANNQIELRNKIYNCIYTKPEILASDIDPALLNFIEKSLKVNPRSRITAKEALLLFEPYKSKISEKKKTNPFKNITQNQKFGGWIILSLFLVVVLVLALSKGNNTIPGKQEKEQTNSNTQVNKNADDLRSVKIDVPGVEDARIILENGQSIKLPYEIKGKNGESVSFTIKADGYKEKRVEMKINHRRNSYDYNLEKNN